MGRASVYFFDSNNSEKQTLHRRITPSDSQFEEQQLRWNALADFLVDHLNGESGYTIRTWLQGSYKFGTQVRPVHTGDEFDIDLGIYYCWSGPDNDARYTPKQLKEIVQGGLRGFKTNNKDVIEVVYPPKIRCCRIRFEGDFHVDVPVYHLDENRDARALATEENRWEASDPKAIYTWFKKQFEDYPRARVRRLVRYFKAWVALKFRDNAGRPSSLLLTVLVTDAVLSLKNGLPGPEDEAMSAVVDIVKKRVGDSRNVINPADPLKKEDLAARLSDDDWKIFRQKLQTFAEVAAQAIETDDDLAACSLWADQFEHLFPLPDVGQVQSSATKSLAVVTQPEVRVQAVSRDNPYLKYSGTNSIGPIPKNCTIAFEVVNAFAMPAGTIFRWVVRNEGDEAEDVNDLGHTAGVGLRAEERSAYGGTHYMDCMAVAAGRIVGLTRVRVAISGMKAPQRNPKKPAYVKLRGKR